MNELSADIGPVDARLDVAANSARVSGLRSLQVGIRAMTTLAEVFDGDLGYRFEAASISSASARSIDMRAWQNTCLPASSAEIVTAECM